MTMTKAEILLLTQDMARGQANDDTIDVFFDEVLYNLAKSANPLLTNAELVDLTSGTAVYALPPTAIRIRHAFFENKKLFRAKRDQAEAYSSTWRSGSGDPQAFLTDEETARNFRLYPTPSVSTVWDDFFIDPLGDDYPDNIVALIFNESRTDVIYDWLVYYIVFEILYREFVRPSDHQDIEWAGLCNKLASFFLLLAST